jgi:UDP-GlcNAc3NAcA epimerase
MKLVTIIGARPQFIKSALLSKFLKKEKVKEVIVDTGQHFNFDMNKIFFNQLKIPSPKYFLNINNLSHNQMIAQMLIKLEVILLKEKPDYVLVYGDTNSTIAGSLAAAKLNIKIIHVESGLRSFNNLMPEEINRKVADHLSSYLLCPNKNSVNNLKKEGIINRKIINTGDVMYDSYLFFKKKQKPIYKFLKKKFILLTMHREENSNLIFIKKIIKDLKYLPKDNLIIFPAHPRLKKILKIIKIQNNNLKIIKPVGYFQMLWLINNCKYVITDSGGLQKEAYFAKKYCFTIRNETEWVELVKLKVNFLIKDRIKIINKKLEILKNKKNFNIKIYGKGTASLKIAKFIKKLKQIN